jgi:hypothetical protein
MTRSYHITKKKLLKDYRAGELNIESCKSSSDKSDLKKEMKWCRKNKITFRNAILDGLIKKLKKAGHTKSGTY